jgi:hypothetical protein
MKKSERDKQNCGNCCFWIVEGEYAYCKCMPPSLIQNDNVIGGHSKDWAETKANDWCGSWQELENI